MALPLYYEGLPVSQQILVYDLSSFLNDLITYTELYKFIVTVVT